MSDDSKSNVLGRRIDLPRGRMVFVGTAVDRPGTVYLGFRNSDGEDSGLVVSDEAAKALRALLTDPALGGEPQPFPRPHRRAPSSVASGRGGWQPVRSHE